MPKTFSIVHIENIARLSHTQIQNSTHNYPKEINLLSEDPMPHLSFMWYCLNCTAMMDNCKTMGNYLQKHGRYPWGVEPKFLHRRHHESVKTLLKTLSRVLSSIAVCCLIRATFCIISCTAGLAESNSNWGESAQTHANN